MSNGDSILLQTVMGAGIRGDSAVTTPAGLSDLNADQILKSVMGCLEVIYKNQRKEFNSEEMTEGSQLSSRFRLGRKCAEACLDLGYPDKSVGYQSFLYSSNQDELRKIFMFLVDKMQVHDVNVDLTDGSNEGEHDDFCSCEKCLDLPDVGDIVNYLPRETRAAYYAKKEQEKRQRANVGVTTDSGQISTTSRPDSDGKPGIAHEPISSNNDPPTLTGLPVNSIRSKILQLENGAAALQDAEKVKQEQGSAGLTDNISDLSQNDSVKLNKIAELESENEVIPPLTDEDAVTLDSDYGDSDEDAYKLKAADENELELLYQEKAKLEEEVENLQVTLSAVRTQAIEKKSNIDEGNELVLQLTAELEKEKLANEKRRKLLTLLPESETNRQKMAQILQKNRDKLESMHLKWTEVQADLEAEYGLLCHEIEKKQEESELEMSRRNSLAEQMATYEEQIRLKDILRVKYTKELAKSSPGSGGNQASRSDHTRQIMEILNTVTRQRSETSGVIADIKIAQNDINRLEGKLYRSYVDADSKVFNMARNDEGQLKPTYRLLTCVHQNCDDIIELIRQTGQTKRATMVVQDQAVVERAKNVGSNNQQLTNDLKQIKEENKVLGDKLTAASNKS